MVSLEERAFGAHMHGDQQVRIEVVQAVGEIHDKALHDVDQADVIAQMMTCSSL